MSQIGLGRFNLRGTELRNILPIGGCDDDQSVPAGTLLAGGAGWHTAGNPPWFDMACWPEGLVTVLADVGSAVNGLEICWSHDGVVADGTLTQVFTVLAGVRFNQFFSRRAQYCQIRYTNGAVIQTAFELYTFFYQAVSTAGAGGGGGMPVSLLGREESKLYPDPAVIISTLTNLRPRTDALYRLQTRGPVLTDEGTLADDFSAAAPGPPARVLTGNSQFTAGSTAVIGVGTLYTTEVRVGDYVELNADHSDTVPIWGQVASIEDNLHLTLVANYAGAGGVAGPASVQNYVTIVSAVGASTATLDGGSYLELYVDDLADASAAIYRNLNVAGRKSYLPLRLHFHGLDRTDQDAPNKSFMFGVASSANALVPPGIPTGQGAYFYLGGQYFAPQVPTNQQVIVVVQSGDLIPDREAVVVDLPPGATQMTQHDYDIVLYADRCEFYCDNEWLHTAYRHVPRPYDPLVWFMSGWSDADAEGYTPFLAVDDIWIELINTLEVRQPDGSDTGIAESYQAPDPKSRDHAVTPLKLRVGPQGHLKTRGPVLTDAGSFGDDFDETNGIIDSGTPSFLNLGNCIFTAGSPIVTGTFGTLDLQVGDYVILAADYDPTANPSLWAQIAEIIDDQTLRLSEPYLGFGGPLGPAFYWHYRYCDEPGGVAGSGVFVEDSLLFVNADGVTTKMTTVLCRYLGLENRKAYAPLRIRFSFMLDAAFNGRSYGYIGVANAGEVDPAERTTYAYFIFPENPSGTGQIWNEVTCAAASDNSVGGTTNVWQQVAHVPAGQLIGELHHFELRLYANRVEYLIDGQMVQTYNYHLPHLYDNLWLIIGAYSGDGGEGWTPLVYALNDIRVECMESLEIMLADTTLRGVARSELGANPQAIGYLPGPSTPRFDALGALITRGPVTTDEGAFTDDFNTLRRNLSGAVTTVQDHFDVLGRDLIAGASRTRFDTEIRVGDYLERVADYDLELGQWTQVSEVLDFFHLRLQEGYRANGGAGASEVCNYRFLASPAGNVAIAASGLNLTLDDDVLDSVAVIRYLGAGGRKATLPLRFIAWAIIDQRRDNQSFNFGLEEITAAGITVGTAGNRRARFVLSGTDTSIVRCETCDDNGTVNYADVEVPFGETTTGGLHKYEICLYHDRCEFYISDVLVFTSDASLPDPYTKFDLYAYGRNTDATAGVTIFTLNYWSVSAIAALQTDTRIASPRSVYTPPTAALPIAQVNDQGATDAAVHNHSINDNNVHSSPVLRENTDYILQCAGGEGICYELDIAAPASIQTLPYLLNNERTIIRTSLPGMMVHWQKRVNGTADATMILVRYDGR